MAVKLPQLRVEEVIEKAASGATEPYFCRLSDDQVYVAKGRAALPRGLIAEVVAGVLGTAYGLPIPPIALAELDSSLVALNRDAQASLAGGVLFASKHCDNLLQVSREMIYSEEQVLLRKIFLFDYWIMNQDRTGTIFGGNSNLFRSIDSRGLVVLDHNLAFDPTFDVEASKKLHICRDFWFGHDRLHLDQATMLADMDAAEAAIVAIEDGLPDDWMEGAPGVVEEMRQILARRHQDAFWEALR